MYTEQELLDIASRFRIEGEIAEIKPLGPGFINDQMKRTVAAYNRI